LKIDASRRQNDPRKIVKIYYWAWCGLEVSPASLNTERIMVMVIPELRFQLASVGAKTRSAKNVCEKDGMNIPSFFTEKFVE